MENTRVPFRMETILQSVKQSCEDLFPETHTQSPYSNSDCFMSAFAMFHLKYPSLLQFEKEHKNTESVLSHNLRTLYGVKNAPSDTTMRERLDNLPYAPINQMLKEQIHKIQRTNCLNDWNFIDGYKLMALDGSQFFTSNSIQCNQCCTKVLNKGKANEQTVYSHNMLVGTLVAPGNPHVLPMCFEPISKQDGVVKNDCEINGGKRLIRNYRKLYPNMPTAVVADSLYSRAPFIRLLQEHRMKFLLVAKDADHKYLNDWFRALTGEDVVEACDVITIKHDTVTCKYRYAKNVPLNAENHDLKVNVIYYEETTHERIIKPGQRLERIQKESVVKWCWVTDFDPTPDNIKLLIKGGRTRSKIENETFNTLKNQGYHFEHNFGHGKKGLSNFLSGIMLLVFLIDQISFALNKSVQKCLKKLTQKKCFWQKMRNCFFNFYIDSWDDLYNGILDPPKKTNIRT